MTVANTNALTLDEVGVSEEDAAQVIYDLRRAFNAAYAYIHNSQDNGAESQARYTAWIEARKKVDAWRR